MIVVVIIKSSVSQIPSLSPLQLSLTQQLLRLMTMMLSQPQLNLLLMLPPSLSPQQSKNQQLLLQMMILQLSQQQQLMRMMMFQLFLQLCPRPLQQAQLHHHQLSPPPAAQQCLHNVLTQVVVIRDVEGDQMMTAGVMMTVETMETVAVTGVITVMKMMMYLILPLTLLSLMSPVTRLVVVLRDVALDQTETAGVMKSVSCAVTVVVTGATSAKLSL